MRFGKTFTTYQLARRMGWTARPRAHLQAGGPQLVARRPGQPRRLRRLACSPTATTRPTRTRPPRWCGSRRSRTCSAPTGDGQVKDHNEDLHLIDWDCIVLDEYHFGAWQGAAKEVCSAPRPAAAEDAREGRGGGLPEAEADHADEVADLAAVGHPPAATLRPRTRTSTADLDAARAAPVRRHYLYLSGTPFRALTEGEFNEDAIYNWTYPDEQAAKAALGRRPRPATPQRNPYRELPQMQMFTYALSEMASAAIDQGADGLFDLSGFFEAKKVGSEYHFTDPERVTEFLNMLRGKLTQSATEKLLNDFKPAVPVQRRAVHRRRRAHRVVPAHRRLRPRHEGGPGSAPVLPRLPRPRRRRRPARRWAPTPRPLSTRCWPTPTKLGKQTITLSVGKLMTGVTVPQWGAILILRSLKSPESYFQAAFRVQSPWTHPATTTAPARINKHTCFVFDFDPNRALTLIYQYGTKLAGGSTEDGPRRRSSASSSSTCRSSLSTAAAWTRWT